MERCILAATDGQPQSIGALRCARDLASRSGLGLEIVSVCEPNAVFGYGSTDLLAGVVNEMAAAALAERRGMVAEQCSGADVEGDAVIHVEIGSPSAVITRIAAERGARLIVVGRGGHSRLDRMLGDETALRLMQTAHTPVVSVPAACYDLPVRALAAVDFTSYSLDAARTAAELLHAGSEIHVVHVNADQSAIDLHSWRETEWGRAMRGELQSRLDQVVRELAAARPAVRVHGHLLEGRTVPTILRLAEELEVDLLAAGTNGYGFLGRLLMGSVATQLVRRAGCITLVAPPRGIVPASVRAGLRRGVVDSMAGLSGTAA